MLHSSKFFRGALCSALLLAVAPSFAEVETAKVFDADYQAVAPVSANQAQVVYYRVAGMGQASGAAHLYVDREFHTGLLPGGFSTFCLAPGEHDLGAYLDDAPDYKGKRSDLFSGILEGGQTYFLKTTGDHYGAPVQVARDVAERELAGHRQQVHVLSRASAVQACHNLPMPVVPQYKDYTLAGDVLFAFGKSGYNDITGTGREAIRQIVADIRRDHPALERIVVVGHADHIGSDDAAQILGGKRADTVRRMLTEGGLPAEMISATSAGNREPLQAVCSGNRAQRIACNEPNRRVVVRVDVSRTAP
jgi:OOP family OmpA-OmpF porin